jgi:hypothetical protein
MVGMLQYIVNQFDQHLQTHLRAGIKSAQARSGLASNDIPFEYQNVGMVDALPSQTVGAPLVVI